MLYKLHYKISFFIVLVIFIFCYTNGYFILHIINKILSPFSNGPTFLPTKDKWCKDLRENYAIIKQEYIDYCKTKKLKRSREIDVNQSALDTGDIPWDVLMLRVFNKNTNKIIHFPKTYQLIKKIPGCTFAMFSVLNPGKHLAPHYGPSKSVLRYHLSLIVPKNNNNCFIKVNDQYYNWQEGQDVMFDDTYLHSVENNTNEPRVVLFLDIKRKYNNIFLDWMNNTILYFAQYNCVVSNIVENTNKS